MERDPDQLAKRIAGLSPARRELLRKLARERGEERPAAGEILPRQGAQSSPLSFAQQRMWFINQLAPGNPFYNESSALPLTLALDLPALHRTINEIVRRHESLRTRFRKEGDQPVQQVLREVDVPLPVEDLRDLPESKRQDQLEMLAFEEAMRPFDLEKGPLIRALLLRTGTLDYHFVLTLHHIVCDGWSMDVFFRELTQLYSAFSTGQPSPLEPLPIQYPDFAVWQRRRLSGRVLDDLLSYWKTQLADLAVLELPTDRRRPSVQSYRGNMESFEIPATVSAAIKGLARRKGVTLFIMLLAVFKVLLHRYTGQTDLVVGVPVSGRDRAETHRLIGFFVNSLVIRSHADKNPTFLEMLERVRQVAVEAYAHQELPFEILVEELNPDRDLSRNPLFQVCFQYFDSPGAATNPSGGAVKDANINRGTSIFDLAFNLWEGERGFEGQIEYSTELFENDTIKRMIGHYVTLLTGIAADPEQRISRLPLLTPRERQQILVDWNQTQAPHRVDVCVHELFEGRARHNGAQIALHWDEGVLTYAELNARANQVAHYLRANGVGPESRVVVCMARGGPMVIAMLGVLKAGGAYLPVDVDIPDERLAFIVRDADVDIVITLRGQRDRVATRIVALETLLADADDLSAENPQFELSATNLAYVIYTSGTSGRPKGVETEHGGLVNLIEWHQRAYALTDSDRAAQVSNAAFDACTWELWPYLAAGARVEFLSDSVRGDTAALVEWLRARRITHCFMPTPLAEAVMKEDWPADMALRVLLTGGDTLREGPPPGLPCRLFNHYGPTEYSVVTTAGPVAVQGQHEGLPSIGRPIANTQIYVLDSERQPVPVGVPAELYISGTGLARGYLNDPELTAMKFVAAPFENGESGARLYRTGDRVRFLANGELEFLGRIDRQIKLRGFRIEPEEIEAVLKEHAEVADAAIVERADAIGGSRLSAYVVADDPLRGSDDGSAQVDLATNQVTRWRNVYDDVYGKRPVGDDPTFNIVGWQSSYTGEPIPRAHMREWLDGTLDRLRALSADRVLEIGCGTGMLLFALAPDCERYVATDFSSTVLDYVRGQATTSANLTLLERTADDFSGIGEKEFDLVILNSVVQYFPQADYLQNVLEQAVSAASPGGAVFVGDVRHFDLLEAFHASTKLSQADSSLSTEALRDLIGDALDWENELLVSPAWFDRLKAQLPRITRVEVLLKAGRHDNELMNYRYDVVLHIDKPCSSANAVAWLDWHSDELSIEDLRRRLAAGSPECLGVLAVPNARIAGHVRLAAGLHDERPPATAGEMRRRVSEYTHEFPNPCDLHALADSLGYTVTLSWARASVDGEYDALFRRKNTDSAPACPGPSSAGGRPLANDPTRQMVSGRLVPKLREYLAQHLPAYMIPADFTLLDSVPLTANGKVDRRSLEARSTGVHRSAGRQPKTDVEKALARIWSELLNTQIAGVDTNFFTDLGGHSLLATQLVSRLRDAFDIDLPLNHIFESPTIAGLSVVVEDKVIDRLEAADDVRLTPAHSATPEANKPELVDVSSS